MNNINFLLVLFLFVYKTFFSCLYFNLKFNIIFNIILRIFCYQMSFVINLKIMLTWFKLQSLKSCSHSRLIVAYEFWLTWRHTIRKVMRVLVNTITPPRECVCFVLSDWQRGDEIIYQGVRAMNNISFERRNLLFLTVERNIYYPWKHLFPAKYEYIIRRSSKSLIDIISPNWHRFRIII